MIDRAEPLAHQPLSEAELQRLSAFLAGIKNAGALKLEGMDGLFCALIAGPDLVMPSEYLPLVWGGELPDENAFQSLEEANGILQLMMRHWNTIAAELAQHKVYEPLILEPDAGTVPGRDWARGFMRGVYLRRAGWAELMCDENEGQLLAIPLVAGEVDPEFPREPLSAEKREELVLWMGAGLARSYRHFVGQRSAASSATRDATTHRRSTPKVGRNDPCPCGSGQKFKHCCGRGGEPPH